MDNDNKTKSGDQSTAKTTSYVKRKQEWFQGLHPDREFISQDDYDRCLGILTAIEREPEANKLLAGSQREVVVLGEIGGLPSKGRLDLLGESIADVKISFDIEKHKFGGTCARLRYLFKMAMYRELVTQATGEVKDVFFITVEEKAPHDCAAVPIPAILLENAMDDVHRTIERYVSARETDAWPGVARGEMYELVVPNWAMPEEELDWS